MFSTIKHNRTRSEGLYYVCPCPLKRTLYNYGLIQSIKRGHGLSQLFCTAIWMFFVLIDLWLILDFVPWANSLKPSQRALIISLWYGSALRLSTFVEEKWLKVSGHREYITQANASASVDQKLCKFSIFWDSVLYLPIIFHIVFVMQWLWRRCNAVKWPPIVNWPPGHSTI